jgi:uncharacterized protein (TIGR02996 family)
VSDEDALLAAICADPADDTARLVFADFLQEHGGPVESAWAMFVRAHLRLGTGVETTGDVPIVQRLSKTYWLQRFAERLGFPVGCAVALEDWQRGFPNEVAAEYPVARERWAALVARVPFQRVRIGGIEDEAVEDLVTWPRLERLTALDLTIWDGTLIERSLSARGVAALARCPALRGLESLRLSYLEVTDRVADLILSSRYLTGLRSLAIYTLAEPHGPGSSRLRERFGPSAVQ